MAGRFHYVLWICSFEETLGFPFALRPQEKLELLGKYLESDFQFDVMLLDAIQEDAKTHVDLTKHYLAKIVIVHLTSL